MAYFFHHQQPPKPVNFGLVNFSRDDDSGDEVAEYSSPAASTAAAAPSGEDEGGGRIRTQEDTDELQGDTTELDEDELRNLANLPRNAVVEDLEGKRVSFLSTLSSHGLLSRT